MFEFIKNWLNGIESDRNLRNMRQIRDEAAEVINIRQVIDRDTDQVRYAIVVNGSILYLADAGQDGNNLIDMLMSLRNYYCRIYGDNPSMEIL